MDSVARMFMIGSILSPHKGIGVRNAVAVARTQETRAHRNCKRNHRSKN